MFRLISVTVLLVATSVFAHARLKTPAPRNNSDLLKDPNGPCGNVARTNTPTVLTMGQTVNVAFEETVNHDGCFTFALSQQNDTNFVVLKMVAHNATGAVPRQYTTTVNLPAGVTCDNCTLQQIQYMLPAGSTCPPATPPAGSRYYSCADVRIVAPDAGSAGGGAGGSGGAGGAGGTGGAGGGSAGGAGGGSAGGSGGAGGGSAGGSGGSGGGSAGGTGGAGGSTMTADAGKGGAGGAAGGTASSTGGSSGGVVSGEDPGAGCAAAPAGFALMALVALGLRRRT